MFETLASLRDRLYARAVTALARRSQRAGEIRRPLAWLERLPVARRPAALEQQLRSEQALLAEPLPAPAARVAPPWDGGRRVLYHVTQSLPHHATGYSIRTQGLVAGLRAHGWDVEVEARFGYPNDGDDFAARPLVAPAATVDGVPYRFAPDPRLGPRPLAAYLEASAASLVERARAQRPAIIHAASNHVVGLAGVEAARRLGLPSIYEVRGLWHLTRAAREAAYLGSDHFGLVEQLEARAAAAAHHTFVITAAVAERLAARGVPRARMTVLPNAVDTARFAPRPRDEALAARWRLGDRPVIGYVGSLLDYEGLDLLLDAAARLRTRHDLRVLIVGDGDARPALASRARALGDTVVLTGRVPHADVARYYSIIDVLAFPRRGLPVCEVVSPLKPFEAMAMARPVVVSSVAALTEIVDHERTGLVHRKDDAASLADQLERCLAQPAWARDLGAAGAAWVREHRSWARVTAQVAAVYKELSKRT